MLFDIRHFEQLFDETFLKKGLKLFETGKVELIEKQQGNDFNFIINKAVSLALKKKGDKLLSYNCSCKKPDFCEHLASVLFYFQQDTLGLVVKKRKSKKAAAALKTSYDLKVDVLRDWIEPYLNIKVLDQAQLDEICKEILKLKKSVKNPEENYDLALALLIVVPSVLQLRLPGDETLLKKQLTSILKELKTGFDLGLTHAQKEKWHRATLESIRNNAVLKSEAYTFLVPRAVTFITSKPDLERLISVLNSRKYKMNYASRFDKLMIAKLEVAIRGSELFSFSFPADYQSAVVELIIAKAELGFCSHKINDAFNYLSENDEVIKQHNFFYYSAYVDYIIAKAQEENKPVTELNYIKKSFLYNAFILPKYLDRFVELVPANELDAVVNELVAWLRNKQEVSAFDKITSLLFSTGRFDELIDEIRKQHNKFNLLHAILLKKLPHYDTDTLALYMQHLLEAFIEAGFYHFQQHTFNKAKNYLDQLPVRIKDDFISELLDRMGRNKQISRYILSL